MFYVISCCRRHSRKNGMCENVFKIFIYMLLASRILTSHHSAHSSSTALLLICVLILIQKVFFKDSSRLDSFGAIGAPIGNLSFARWQFSCLPKSRAVFPGHRDINCHLLFISAFHKSCDKFLPSDCSQKYPNFEIDWMGWEHRCNFPIEPDPDEFETWN